MAPWREAARLVVIDQDNSLLLIESVDPTDARSVWITPGGALEPGEHHVQAAMRELREETGIHEVSVGPWVWTREHIFSLDGQNPPATGAVLSRLARRPHD